MARLREADSARRQARPNAHDFSEALARGLEVLGAFSPTLRQASLSELAEAARLPRASTRRALLTLAEHGLVETDGRLFRVTPGVLGFAAAYLRASPVTTALQPVCERLAAEMEALCSASVLDGEDAVLVARAAPAQAGQIASGIGFRMPAFCSAGGRMLLSTLPDAALDAWLERLEPRAQTAHTITDKPRLRDAILAARADGYALVSEETELGLRSIAILAPGPVPGSVPAALGVGLHVERGSREMLLGPCLARLRAATA